MSDLTDKQWEEYLAKEKRDVLWRALQEVRSIQACCAILENKSLYEKAEIIGNELEKELKEKYDNPNAPA